MSKPVLPAPGLASSLSLPAGPAHRLWFFTTSSGFGHDVISWENGQPGFAEKIAGLQRSCGPVDQEG